jgi:hypothetical protein
MNKKSTIGILTAITAVAASIYMLTQGNLSADISTSPTETPTPTVASVTQPCAYTWAYQDLPEISAAFESAVQAIVPEAEAHATAFGEDCVAADGSAAFGAMETDFYIRIPVTDLNDDATLGNLVEQLLPVMDQFPHERLSGPKDGFVEFDFLLGESQRVIRVQIPMIQPLRERGLHGAELLQAIEVQ